MLDEVTLSGYGIFLVNGRIQIYDDLATDSGTEETTIGLYSSKQINFFSSGVAISAQVFANGRIEMMDNTTVYGNLTARANINFYDGVTIHYRPASPVLTTLIWPNE